MGGDSLSVPILYEANATDFNNLGLGPLVDTTVATVTEERNGQFILEMQYPVDGIRASLITKNRILKVDAGHKLKDQRFVIKRINRIMGNDGLSYSIYAEHISYITADYALKPSLTVNGSGNVAMTQWLNGIIDSNRIHVDSDITTENTTSWTIDKVQNARQALGGVQGSILDVWGGEYRFDNLNISLLKHRGTVSNTLLSYGRNITDFDQEENITNTYTSIYPFASYSVQNGDTSEQKILTIPDLVVDSEYVKNFPNRKIQVVDFSDKFSTDETPTVKRLTELAKSYIKNNNVGVPTVSTKISFVDLSKTENYKEFAPLEELDLCDEVPFAFEKFGIKTTAKISRIVWNILLDSYDSLELGELKTNLSDVINNTNNAALDAKDAANDAKNSADNAALSANGKNRNWYGADDPAFGHLSELREGDSWYKPNGEDTELYHWINGQWVFILSTKTANDAADAADKASKEAEEAKKQANKAVDGANDAVAKAGFANDTADQAKSDAATAGQQAKDALTSAGTAITDAQKALTNSSSAMADSDQARKDSATAIKDAADSLTSAKDAINKVGNLTTSVTSQFTTVNNELKSKVNQTDYDKLKGTVTTQQTEINQNASGIKLKADKSYTDTINNSVVKNTSSIGLLNNQIALTVSKAELNNTLSSYATQTWTQGQIKTTADSINLSVSKVQSGIDNLNSGDRNLILGSANWKNLGFYNVGGFTKSTYNEDFSEVTSVGQEGGPFVHIEHLSKRLPNTGDTVIISVEAKGTGVLEIRYAENNVIQENKIYKLSDSYTRYYLKVKWVAKDAPGIGFFNSNKEADKHVTLRRPKIVVSSVFNSDWSPAPEDSVTDVEFAELAVKVDGITATVDSKADKTQITQLSDQIKLKADTTALNELKGTVDKQGSEITLNTNSIKLKADQSSVDTLKGTVDKQGSAIDVNTKAIALKANQSTIDTLTGRVSTAEGKITVQADQISQTVSKTELTSKLNGYATQTWSEGKISAAKTAINLSVEQSITTSENTLNNNIANTTKDMATQTWTQGQINTTADAINLSVSKVQTDLSGTKTQFAELAVKVDGIQTTVKDKADKSQITQLVGQVTSVVSTANGNSSQITQLSKDINLRVTADQVDASILADKTIKDTRDDNQPPSWYYANYPTQIVRELKNSNKIGISDSEYASLETNVPWLDPSGGKIKQMARTNTQTWQRFSIDTSSWGAWAIIADTSNVISQINISPESILIAGQKVHITGQTSIDNAVIKDAMIANVTADKITAGTLNAANVNVINLNANNITTGTIRGANLSLNLNTGEVAFQKGSIRSTNGNLNIRIDDGSMSLTNSLGNGAYFKDGNIYMTDSDFWTPGNPKIQYGTLKMVPNFMSDAGGGVALKGPNGVVVGTDKYSDTGIFGDLLSSSSGGGITLTNEHVRMASEGAIGIAGGKMYNTGYVGNHPGIQVGIAGSYTAPMPWFPSSSEIGDALFLSGKVVGVVADGGDKGKNISDLSVAGDTRSGYVLSAATYKRTYGSGDTVTITPNGVFGRISSASKYKLAIGEISTLNDEAHQFLSVKPKQWFDKSETEALADSMTTGNTDYVDDAKALPHNGFIAEDLYTAGLDSYVIRSNDGSIESIQYDRLPVLHHELIRELFNRLDAAEMEIYKLKQEVLNNAN
ncbi:hypothetical protein EFR51_03665 [Latilactobacillus curvatus]|uniref:phage tail spike protein n=1 Tax=Latilactobacillus curvatus TaxID=28038 RepID=UPI0021A61653|nr:phage tail spike protein [Latilactobacillus curvatus]MCT3532240.1 hypothetical protein [Latilactobacillus curvatus]